MNKFETANVGYSYHLPTAGLALKIRNSLAQVSELFSEFNKHIAPAYHHDRCDRSVQMRLYSMHKREFVMVFVAFFALFGLALFIGLAGPPITTRTAIDGRTILQEAQNHSAHSEDIATGPFTMRTPLLNTYCQQMWLIAKLGTNNPDDETFDHSFKVNVNIEGLTAEHKPVPYFHGNNARNSTRTLRCRLQDCDEFVVLHLGFLDYHHYIITLKFFDLKSFNLRFEIKDLTFFFITYNPGFTQIEIWFRFIFLLIAFVVTCWFAHTLKRYLIRDWSIEQKWMAMLLPMLLFYNNPLFPLTFLVHSWMPGLYDAMTQSSFLCALLLFWLCIYHGLRQNERPFIIFYLPKILVVGMIWLAAIVLAGWERYNEMVDPTYSHMVDAASYNRLKVFFYVSAGIYLAYLALLMLRAYTELRSMPYFDMRLKFLTLLLIVVLAVSAAITGMRFGFGVLEDNFAAQLATHYSSSAPFMSFYGLLNFYVYVMAYVYAPGNKSLQDASITKDNPAFSMINDSDEDVVYGSDEESRRPLTRPHQDDDSD